MELPQPVSMLERTPSLSSAIPSAIPGATTSAPRLRLWPASTPSARDVAPGVAAPAQAADELPTGARCGSVEQRIEWIGRELERVRARFGGGMATMPATTRTLYERIDAESSRLRRERAGIRDGIRPLHTQ